VKIAIEAQRDAGQGGSTEPQNNVEGIHLGNLAEAVTGQKAPAADCGARMNVASHRKGTGRALRTPVSGNRQCRPVLTG
jgi:hypothetical protein